MAAEAPKANGGAGHAKAELPSTATSSPRARAPTGTSGSTDAATSTSELYEKAQPEPIEPELPVDPIAYFDYLCFVGYITPFYSSVLEAILTTDIAYNFEGIGFTVEQKSAATQILTWVKNGRKTAIPIAASIPIDKEQINAIRSQILATTMRQLQAYLEEDPTLYGLISEENLTEICTWLGTDPSARGDFCFKINISYALKLYKKLDLINKEILQKTERHKDFFKDDLATIRTWLTNPTIRTELSKLDDLKAAIIRIIDKFELLIILEMIKENSLNAEQLLKLKASDIEIAKKWNENGRPEPTPIVELRRIQKTLQPDLPTNTNDIASNDDFGSPELLTSPRKTILPYEKIIMTDTGAEHIATRIKTTRSTDLFQDGGRATLLFNDQKLNLPTDDTENEARIRKAHNEIFGCDLMDGDLLKYDQAYFNTVLNLALGKSPSLTSKRLVIKKTKDTNYHMTLTTTIKKFSNSGNMNGAAATADNEISLITDLRVRITIEQKKLGAETRFLMTSVSFLGQDREAFYALLQACQEKNISTRTRPLELGSVLIFVKHYQDKFLEALNARTQLLEALTAHLLHQEQKIALDYLLTEFKLTPYLSTKIFKIPEQPPVNEIRLLEVTGLTCGKAIAGLLKFYLDQLKPLNTTVTKNNEEEKALQATKTSLLNDTCQQLKKITDLLEHLAIDSETRFILANSLSLEWLDPKTSTYDPDKIKVFLRQIITSLHFNLQKPPGEAQSNFENICQILRKFLTPECCKQFAKIIEMIHKSEGITADKDLHEALSKLELKNFADGLKILTNAEEPKTTPHLDATLVPAREGFIHALHTDSSTRSELGETVAKEWFDPTAAINKEAIKGFFTKLAELNHKLFKQKYYGETRYFPYICTIIKKYIHPSWHSEFLKALEELYNLKTGPLYEALKPTNLLFTGKPRTYDGALKILAAAPSRTSFERTPTLAHSAHLFHTPRLGSSSMSTTPSTAAGGAGAAGAGAAGTDFGPLYP